MQLKTLWAFSYLFWLCHSSSWSAKSYLNGHTFAWGTGQHIQQWWVIYVFAETSLALKLMTLKQELRELYRFSALLKYYKNSWLLFVKPRLEGKVLGTSSHDGIQLGNCRARIQFNIKDIIMQVPAGALGVSSPIAGFGHLLNRF